jgi:transcriptional regulator with PAS, ATPase and Fis domain
VGSDSEVPIDVRIIAASNRPLTEMVRLKRFRADLYYRLNVVHLSLPPLRERISDLGALILEFARRHQDVYAGISAVEPELTSHLASQKFEGNLRELEHCVQRMLFKKTEGGSLGLSDWMAQYQSNYHEASRDPVREAARTLWGAVSRDGVPFALALRLTERHILEFAISSSPRGRRELAQRLQTSERTLYRRLQSHGLTPRLSA